MNDYEVNTAAFYRFGFFATYWVAVGEPSHKMGTGLSPASKMTKLRNLYPEGTVCVLRFRCLRASFRTIEESILGVLEAVQVAIIVVLILCLCPL